MSFKYTPIQRAWLDALKSGKFRQGRKRLAIRTKNKKVDYCCLGVACVVANRMGRKLKKSSQKDILGDVIAFNDSAGALPTVVTRTLNLRDDVGSFKQPVSFNGISSGCLASLNDNGQTHKKIAEYIELNPTNVFKS